MASREHALKHPVWEGREAEFLPLCSTSESDSANLDHMAEFMMRGGVDPQEALMVLVPEAYRNHPELATSYPQVPSLSHALPLMHVQRTPGVGCATSALKASWVLGAGKICSLSQTPPGHGRYHPSRLHGITTGRTALQLAAPCLPAQHSCAMEASQVAAVFAVLSVNRCLLHDCHPTAPSAGSCSFDLGCAHTRQNV